MTKCFPGFRDEFNFDDDDATAAAAGMEDGPPRRQDRRVISLNLAYIHGRPVFVAGG